MRRSSIRIRAARVDEVSVLVEFGRELRDLPSGRRHGCPAARDSEERYRAVLDDPARRVVLAVDEADRPIGMAIFALDIVGELLDVPAVRVSHLVVDRAQRRRGAGRALVAAAASYAEEAGVEHVMTGAAPTSRDSNRFLARLGFAPVVVRRVGSLALLRRNLGLATAAQPRGARLRNAQVSRAVQTRRPASSLITIS